LTDGGALFFEDRATGKDDVVALLVELDDLEFCGQADVAVGIG